MKSQQIQISAGQEVLSYSLKRSSRRCTLGITIKADLRILVFAPSALSQRQIDTFIRKKIPWILQKRQDIRFSGSLRVAHCFREGETFLFLGKPLRLVFTPTDKKRVSLRLFQEKFIAAVPRDMPEGHLEYSLKKAMISWYRNQAKEVLATRVFQKSRNLGVEVKEIFVRTQKTIWGSCHYHRKRLYLNWKIVMAPVDVIDYVIIHELCHLMFPHHSRKFWDAVKKAMPHYPEKAQWLKTHSGQMVV